MRCVSRTAQRLRRRHVDHGASCNRERIGEVVKSIKEVNLRLSLLVTAAHIIAWPALFAVPSHAAPAPPIPPTYLDNSTRDDVLSGGVKMIPIQTSKGTFHVWTKRIGNNPKIKVLLLHGGPGFSHEYLEAFDSYFPGAGIEYYYYDQLGSFFSDQPDEPELWELPRFVEEVETVRKALGLGPDNFYLWGGSWGGLLAMEHALKYQQNLKGLIISNMVASIPLYNEYAAKVIVPQMDPAVLTEIKKLEAAGDPRPSGPTRCSAPSSTWITRFVHSRSATDDSRVSGSQSLKMRPVEAPGGSDRPRVAGVGVFA